VKAKFKSGDNMKTYLVGGAVRDSLLNIDHPSSASDRDFVVTGSSPKEMISLGFQNVGKSFPVFLHPKTKEEYALARKEIKTGTGHQAFAFEFPPTLSLEEDLVRRDLTINAMAQEVLADGSLGSLVDPFQGQDDIKNKILRHVSPHFAEDPLRVLRVARFAAKFPDFQVAPETVELLKNMSKGPHSELKTLSGERILGEIEKTFAASSPERFFELLSDWGSLEHFLPELQKLKGVMASPKYHPEGDSFTHTLLVLKTAKKLAPANEQEILFSCLVHDLGKGETPADILPKHTMHEIRGLPLVNLVCERLRVKKSWKELALKVTEFHLQCHHLLEMRPSTIWNLLQKLDAFRRPELLKQFVLCCRCDQGGKLRDPHNYPSGDALLGAHAAALTITSNKSLMQEIKQKYSGLEISEEVKKRQIMAIKEYLGN
jgi:tRNA nucleotidyltransferase (CCA-adding enzyme)